MNFLRFISVLCPINTYLGPAPGDAHTLPYVGQATLLCLSEGDEIWIDSEDFESAFNLLRTNPPGLACLFLL